MTLMHSKIALLIPAFALATGCVPPEDHIADVLPRAADLQIDVPDTADEARTGSSQQQLLGQLADYYIVTRNVSRDLNRGVAGVLLLVHAVVQLPPTSVEGEVYTWGPHADALAPAEWRLAVTEHDGGGRYTWQLDGRDRTTTGTAFETLISGEAYPGDEPHRGHGGFVLDFDAAERVNPIDNGGQRGLVSVEYDLENRDGTPATVALIVDTLEADAAGELAPVHYEYGYRESLDGSGDFRFAIHGDLDDAGDAAEDAEILSRWLTSGEGRSDVTLAGGDLGDLVVTATECWDQRFRRVFYADSASWKPSEGDAGSCAL